MHKYNHPTQSSTIAIRTSQHTTKNSNRACLSATVFLLSLKTNFFGYSSASIGRISDCKELIMSPETGTPAANKVSYVIRGKVVNLGVSTINKQHNGLICQSFETRTTHTLGR